MQTGHDFKEIDVAYAVISILHTRCNGKRIRWGRSKIHDTFEGSIVGVFWKPRVKRRGGFVFLIKYTGIIQHHKLVMKRMLQDYIAKIAYYQLNGYKANGRKKELKIPKTLTVDGSKGILD